MRHAIFLCVLSVFCLGADSDCTAALSGFDQDTIDVEIFNDSNLTVHALLDGEARDISNRLTPGQSRLVQARFIKGGDLGLRFENSSGFLLFGSCVFVDQDFDSDNPVSGQVMFTRNPAFDCSGSAFN